MSARAFIAFMAVLAVLGLLGFGLLSEGEEQIEVGDQAPDGALPVLVDAGGETAAPGGPPTGAGSASELEIADFRGRWVLVNFWASWCVPCREESPDLEAYWQKHRDDGFVVLGIDTEDLSEDARAFIDEFNLTYPNVRDGEGERKDQFGLIGFPESFLVDPDGDVALIRRGPVDTAYLEEQVTPFLRDGGHGPAGGGGASGQGSG